MQFQGEKGMSWHETRQIYDIKYGIKSWLSVFWFKNKTILVKFWHIPKLHQEQVNVLITTAVVPSLFT